METESHDVTAAMLLWLPDGRKPTPEDFDEQRQDLNPTAPRSKPKRIRSAIKFRNPSLVTKATYRAAITRAGVDIRTGAARAFSASV
jgi:hypothetical protein